MSKAQNLTPELRDKIAAGMRAMALGYNVSFSTLRKIATAMETGTYRSEGPKKLRPPRAPEPPTISAAPEIAAAMGCRQLLEGYHRYYEKHVRGREAA